jgi:hypothetical protein
MLPRQHRIARSDGLTPVGPAPARPALLAVAPVPNDQEGFVGSSQGARGAGVQRGKHPGMTDGGNDPRGRGRPGRHAYGLVLRPTNGCSAGRAPLDTPRRDAWRGSPYAV